MQTASFETERRSLDLSICVPYYTVRARYPKGQGNISDRSQLCSGASQETFCHPIFPFAATSLPPPTAPLCNSFPCFFSHCHATMKK